MAWDVIEFTENVCWRWDVKRCQVKDRDAEIEMKDAKLKTKMPNMNVTFSWCFCPSWSFMYMVRTCQNITLILSGLRHSAHQFLIPNSFPLLDPGGAPVSAIIPLDSIVCSCYLTPKFGMTYHPAKWTSAEVLEECKSFTFNKYITLAMFYNLEKY